MIAIKSLQTEHRNGSLQTFMAAGNIHYRRSRELEPYPPSISSTVWPRWAPPNVDHRLSFSRRVRTHYTHDDLLLYKIDFDKINVTTG